MNNNESNSNNSPSGEKLISREPIKNSPFVWVKFDNEIGFLTWGKYKLPFESETFEEMVNFMDSNMWDIMICLTGIISEVTCRLIMEEKNNE